MTEPRTLAAQVLNQVYAAHNVPTGGDMYKLLHQAFADALDFYGQQCALQRQMDRLLIEDEDSFVIPSGGNDTVN
jgi:hypothetical protein